MTEQSQQLTRFGLILGASIVIAALIASITFYQAKSLDDGLVVTGSARKQVKSDSVKWNATFTRVVRDIKNGYTQLDKDRQAVLEFFKKNGFEEKDVNISPVFMYQNPIYENNQQITEYNLSQRLDLQSTDIDKITMLAKNTNELIEKGVIFTTDSLEYYYTKLPELRVSLLSEAVEDARTRAKHIAESGGRDVGDLKTASMGVVQVLSANSTEISDYGSYDTSKIDKEVMVTVKATFALD